MNMSAAIEALAEKYLGEYKVRNGQLVAKSCPFCHGGEHNDPDTFAIGLENGAYSCLRGGCNKTGSFRDLCNHFGETAPSIPNKITRQVKHYDRPKEEDLHPYTEEIRDYFALRCISEETMRAFHISSDEQGNIVFPFYRDGILTYVKYRKPRRHVKGDGPKEWQMANTESIPFGMDMVSFNKQLFITEGQMDAMSLYEAGITNVISVPCGVNNLDFITTCWDWLEKFREIVLFGDSDEPGMEMVNTLMQRLGEDRCRIPDEYPELIINGKPSGRPCKDANEILYCYGKEGLREVAESCKPVPVKGILNLADVPFIDPSQTPRIFTRVPALDNAIGGLSEGGLTIFSGKKGEGKSTLSGQILLNAIQQGYNVCAYSGELSAYKFLEWIMLQATENKYVSYKTDPRSGKNYACVAPEIQRRIKQWINNKFFLFDNSQVYEESTQDAIIKMFTVCARRNACKIFLADNLMCAMAGEEDELKAQANFSAKLKAFAVKYKVHVILVAHPRKQKADAVFTSDDIAGSNVIGNLADNIINVEKPNLRITKNRDFGELAYIECSFDPATRRIFQTSFGDRTSYGWDHEGIQIPEFQAAALPEFAIKDAKPAAPI